MSLRATFDQLVAEARRRGGHAAERELAGGATLRVRAQPGTDRIMLVISRVGMLVGEKELETFAAHCRIPADAERRPAEGQEHIAGEEGQPGRYRVAFIWDRPRELFD